MIQIVNSVLINIKETALFANQGLLYFLEPVYYLVMIQIVNRVLIKITEPVKFANPMLF